MTATVRFSVWGGWVGSCTQCKETIAGSSNMAHIWADIHNQDNHQQGAK